MSIKTMILPLALGAALLTPGLVLSGQQCTETFHSGARCIVCTDDQTGTTSMICPGLKSPDKDSGAPILKLLVSR